MFNRIRNNTLFSLLLILHPITGFAMDPSPEDQASLRVIVDRKVKALKDQLQGREPEEDPASNDLRATLCPNNELVRARWQFYIQKYLRDVWLDSICLLVSAEEADTLRENVNNICDIRLEYASALDRDAAPEELDEIKGRMSQIEAEYE